MAKEANYRDIVVGEGASQNMTIRIDRIQIPLRVYLLCVADLFKQRYWTIQHNHIKNYLTLKMVYFNLNQN